LLSMVNKVIFPRRSEIETTIIVVAISFLVGAIVWQQRERHAPGDEVFAPIAMRGEAR
jgi:hypothetical protein